MNAEFCVAVHGLVYLYHKGVTVSSNELAENICTNPARVRKVMSELRRAGLVCSTEGKGSGYNAAPGAESVTLLEVLRALGERPVCVKWRSGDVDCDCLVSSGMGAVMDDIFSQLNALCETRLSEMTIGDLNNRIFPPKTGE